MEENLDVERIEPSRVSESISLRRLWGKPGEPRLLRLDFGPRAQWPGVDVHEPGQELVYVLSGVFVDEGREFRAGTFLRYAVGSSHSPHAGPEGASLLVFYPDG